MNNQIIATSSPKQRKYKRKFLYLFYAFAFAFIPSLGFACPSYDGEKLRFENLYNDPIMKYPMCIITLLYFIFVFFYTRRISRKLDDDYSNWVRALNCEKLVLETGGLYGSNADGEISLNYSQIKTVDLNGDELIIVDADGCLYHFITFENAYELCLIIQSKIR